MQNPMHRKSARVETSRADLWRWPVAAGVVGLVLGLVLAPVRPSPESFLSRLAWPGDVDSASTLLQTIAAAAITTITLTFSLTVVALQLASQQFSPRLLRDFTRDRVTKSVLAVLVVTFVFALTVVRGLRAELPVPAPAMLVAFLLSFAALLSVLMFISHITRVLRVDTMMVAVHDEAIRAIDTFYPEYGDPRPHPSEELGLALEDGAVLGSRGSGFVRTVDVEGLVAAARERDVVVALMVRPGDHVVRGTPLATVWPAAAGSDEALAEAIASVVSLAYERTIEQDAGFAFRQLTDIAVKALSPGINDPVTAVHAVGHLTDLTVRLTGKRLGGTLHLDETGTGRAVVGDRDLRYYLDLICGQIRRYGDREPTVLTALLRLLRDVAVHARDDLQRAEVERQVGLVLDEVPTSLADVDVERVHDLAERVRAALGGRVLAAYEDRSGETRSL